MMRKKFLASALALSMLTPTIQTGISSEISSWIRDTASYLGLSSTYNQRCVLLALCVLYGIGTIRLITRSRKKTDTTIYKWKDLLKVWNINTNHYWNTVDALVVGDQFKLEERAWTETKNDVSYKIKDKFVKQKPSGFVGLTNAYIVIQLEGLMKIVKGFDDIFDRSSKFLNVGLNINIATSDK